MPSLVLDNFKIKLAEFADNTIQDITHEEYYSIPKNKLQIPISN